MKLLFATGGTAGHINPALAVASYLREKYPEAEFLFVGTADHMESRLVPAAGFDFKTIQISGFRRSFFTGGHCPQCAHGGLADEKRKEM